MVQLSQLQGPAGQVLTINRMSAPTSGFLCVMSSVSCHWRPVIRLVSRCGFNLLFTSQLTLACGSREGGAASARGSPNRMHTRRGSDAMSMSMSASTSFAPGPRRTSPPGRLSACDTFMVIAHTAAIQLVLVLSWMLVGKGMCSCFCASVRSGFFLHVSSALACALPHSHCVPQPILWAAGLCSHPRSQLTQI